MTKPRQIQIRRGTATEHENFTGAVGEITMDTTNKTIRVHDGQTPGGTILAKQSEIQTVPNFAPDYDNETKITNGTIYYADKTYLAIIARGSGANAVLEVSRNADMSNKKLIANIYITSSGNIMFAMPAIIPAGYYYRTTNVGETRLYPIV